MISQETIFQLLSDIDYYHLVSFKLQREDDVQSQVQASIDLVRSSTPIEITSFLRFLQLIYRSSELVSALGTNANIYRGTNEPSLGGNQYPFLTSNFHTDFCAESNLVGPAFFFPAAREYYEANDNDWSPDYGDYGDNNTDSNHSATMKGYFGGCFPLDALLASTLQCLYDIQCLNI